MQIFKFSTTFKNLVVLFILGSILWNFNTQKDNLNKHNFNDQDPKYNFIY